MARSLGLSDELYAYVQQVGTRVAPAQQGLREATRGMQGAGMQIGADQGQFMGFLVKALGVRRALEIGTFTGYSALSVALALPPEGRLVCCDISAEYPAIGQPFWEQAGIADRIDLRIGPAVATLDRLIAEGSADSFDFAFIDADKSNYDAYYERCLVLVRQGGVIAVDNVLWSGAVIDPEKNSEDTQALRALNRKLHADERVDLSMLAIGDGLTLLRRR
jgi:predicted O-methyltransferase YrrM